MTRTLKFYEAILEASDQCLKHFPESYIMGLGATDPKGIFGTTLGLEKKYGNHRILDMPTSENGMTGVAIGSAIMGMRPILTHQRVDFMLLSLDQIINNAAKWHYMFNGEMKVPLVIRLIVGRGWGQGPQHSQSLHALFAHIPGLKVVIPSTPSDAKGLLVSSVEDNNPVIYIEHRWLHNVHGEVSEDFYRTPLGKAKVVQEGKDITLVATSHMVIESLKVVQFLSTHDIHVELIDPRTIKPLDTDSILKSVQKTKRLVVADGDWQSLSIASEVITLVSENLFSDLATAPSRVCYPDFPTPTSWALANYYYPQAIDIAKAILKSIKREDINLKPLIPNYEKPLDVPDSNFTGPF